ncbi:calcium ion binding protein [Actinidia rufa]|uniref:Calcium ion binding protein n=1 Tax=Actinidia rufa TaxID=165716 RepID=A0A7J0GQ91_9ERIC|nr:calcium ion binding protein [Actinidia rufa]
MVIKTQGSEQSKAKASSQPTFTVKLDSFSSDFSMTDLVIVSTEALGDASGVAAAAKAMSSPVLRIEESVWKVAFSTWVKTLVRALEDFHGSGGSHVMEITVLPSHFRNYTGTPESVRLVTGDNAATGDVVGFQCR